ncbi:hypothetical protein AZ46_0207900 [Metabacillus indicus LMG 22858]|nr:hypothetical protein AZ46_0207900 [Metabacillus indicus LMG 22858]
MLKQHIIFYTVIFLGCFLLGFFEAPIYLIGLLLTLSMGWYMYVQISPVLFSKDIRKSESYILKHQSNPMYQFYYAVANNLDDEAEEAMGKFQSKYKNSERRALIQTTYALYKQEPSEAKKYLHLIKSPAYRTYYEGLIAAESRKFKEARDHAERLQEGWMKNSILAEMAEKQGKKSEAKERAAMAFEQTRGLQRYILYKNFEAYLAS